MVRISSLILLIGILHTLSLNSQTNTDWKTFWEKSDYLETPRYKETIEFCKRLDDASKMISYKTFGKSPQGRDLPLLILDKDGYTAPQQIREAGRIIVLVEACIHPGEAEGKDALLAMYRDIAIHQTHNEFLNDVSILFIPIFNVDGHERFTAFSRINQNGPKEGGWRTTAQNLNLNRDFVKADAPEMRAWLQLFNLWNPEFFIDCHTTDGADYQYTLTYAVSGYAHESVQNWVDNKYVPELTTRMEKKGLPIFPYVMFRNWHDPRSGLNGGMAPPRYSNGYTSLRNRPGLLIETHMLKDYKPRVIATYEMVYTTLLILSKQKKELQKQIRAGEKFYSSDEFLEQACVLRYSLSKTDSTMVAFKGIDYTVEKSDLTGGNWYKYNGKEQDFLLPFFNTSVAVETVKLPKAYIVPVEWSDIIDKVKLHGVKYYELQKDHEIEIETYHLSNFKWKPKPYEGRIMISDIEVAPFTRSKRFAKGSIIISMNQPSSYLVALMLEPKSEESFLKWGYFNAIFEQKEYVETYVMEKMAREMMKEDPKLLESFKKWKSENPDVKDKPYQQLMWFYKKTPYFDKEQNVYPIGRINSGNALNKLLKEDL